MITNNIVDLIGNTPLIKLKYPSEITNCEIYGKAEFLNPGQSIKDRAALHMIMTAKNKDSSNKLIVEGTGGNTGIGLTVIGNALGYKTLIVMPENQSIEKINLLQNLGAKVVLTKQLPFSDPNNYIQLAKKIAKCEKVSKVIFVDNETLLLPPSWAQFSSRIVVWTLRVQMNHINIRRTRP